MLPTASPSAGPTTRASTSTSTAASASHSSDSSDSAYSDGKAASSGGSSRSRTGANTAGVDASLDAPGGIDQGVVDDRYLEALRLWRFWDRVMLARATHAEPPTLPQAVDAPTAAAGSARPVGVWV